MNILKSVIHDTKTNSVEATWEDANGVQIKCHSYADVQMDMFRADVLALGGNIAEHEGMIATVEAAIVPPSPPTVDQIVADITSATQARLDTFARTRNYDGILSACTYATSTHPKFASEGQYCVTARDATWSALYVVMAEVEAGARPMPTGFQDIEPDLPALVWPA